MRRVTLFVLLMLAVTLIGCNGTGSNGNTGKVKTGCMSLVKLIK